LWGAIAPPYCAKVRYWRTNGLRLIRRTRAHFGGGGAHRLDDILIPGTAAQIGREHVDQVHIADVGLAFEHADDQHEEARRAEAALQPVMVHEGALEGMQLVALGQSLHGADRFPVGLHGEHQARADRLALDEYRAGAAHAVLAPDMGAGLPAI